MSEFLFKNLSVKLFPTTPEAPQPCPVCSVVASCGLCSTISGGCCAHSVGLSACQGACSFTASVCDACTLQVTCGPCSTQLSACRGGCSVVISICQAGTCPAGSGCPAGSLCGGSVIGPERPAADVRSELAALKEQLHQALAGVEAKEQQLAEAAKPKTIEEVDQLKSQLMDAVAELDERRAELEGKGPRRE